MESDDVHRTLAATRELLEALDTDQSLLHDEYFMQKLSYLRKKHKQTSRFLGKVKKGIVSGGECENSSIYSEEYYEEPIRNGHRGIQSPSSHYSCTSHRTITPHHQSTIQPQYNHYSAYKASTTHRTDEGEVGDGNCERKPRISVHSAPSHQLRRNTEDCHEYRYPRSIMKKPGGSPHQIEPEYSDEYYTDEYSDYDEEIDIVHGRGRRRESRLASLAEPRHPIPRGLTGKSKSLHDIRSKIVAPTRDKPRIPQVTIPKPFKITERPPHTNTYSKRFVESLLEEKRKQEEEEKKSAIAPKFKARPPPRSTYVPDNQRVLDGKYAESIRCRLEVNMRARQIQERMKKSRSMGDLTTKSPSTQKARPVPLSTYIPPQSKTIAREKKTHERSLNLLNDASTPPGLKEHAVRSQVRQNLRHFHCRDEDLNRYRHLSKSVPDFASLHLKMQNKLDEAMQKRPPTIPRPFNFQYSKSKRHNECLSQSPPPRIHVTLPPMEDGPPVPLTRGEKLRQEAVRKKMEEKEKRDNASKYFWESKRDEMDENRRRLAQKLSSEVSVATAIEEKTLERRRQLVESTREYAKQLQEMRARIMSRPLVLEQQASLIHKQAFERKYQKRMSEFEKSTKKYLKPQSPKDGLLTRHASNETFLVAQTSKNGSKTSTINGKNIDEDFESESSEGSSKGNGDDTKNLSNHSSSRSTGSSDNSKSSNSSKMSSHSEKLSKISEHSEKSSSKSSTSSSSPMTSDRSSSKS